MLPRYQKTFTQVLNTKLIGLMQKWCTFYSKNQPQISGTSLESMSTLDFFCTLEKGARKKFGDIIDINSRFIATFPASRRASRTELWPIAWCSPYTSCFRYFWSIDFYLCRVVSRALTDMIHLPLDVSTKPHLNTETSNHTLFRSIVLYSSIKQISWSLVAF